METKACRQCGTCGDDSMESYAKDMCGYCSDAGNVALVWADADKAVEQQEEETVTPEYCGHKISCPFFGPDAFERRSSAGVLRKITKVEASMRIGPRISKGHDAHMRTINGTTYLFTRAAGRIFVHRLQTVDALRWHPYRTF